MSKNLKIFFFSLAILISNSICSIAQSETWQRVFGLDSNVQGFYGLQTNDGGFLILGQWSPESAFPNQTRVIRLDQFGNLIWMKNHLVQTKNSVIQDSDSTFILIGYGGLSGGGLFKINYQGDSILYREYGGGSIERFNSIKEYYDGGFIISGEKSNGLNSKGYVLRLNEDLNVMWENAYYDSSYNSTSLGGEFVFDSNNNIAIPCGGYSVETGLGDGGLLKLNPDGNLYLKKFYITSVRDGFEYIKIIGDKYALGGLASPVITYYALIDTNGSLISSRYYNDARAVYRLLTNSSSNELAFGGYDEDNSQTKMGIRKIDFMGNIIWTRKISNALHISAPWATITTSDHGYLLTGIYEDSITHMFSLYVVKCDSSANTKPISISNQDLTVPDKFVLHHPFPNPFNGNVKIKYELFQKKIYSMSIYDITGKLISSVFNEIKNPGFYEIDLGEYFITSPSSVYFINLISNTDILTRKIIYVK